MAKLSIKEIAALCGVSTATVSRVINNKEGRYSDKTAEKIRQIIQENNYQPNQIAKGLRVKRLDGVGIVVPDITNEFFSSIVLGLQEKLFSAGFSCFVYNTNEQENVERRCIESLMATNVSGIVSVNGHIDLSSIFPTSLPVIYIDRDPSDIQDKTGAAFVSSDHENGAYMAIQELAHVGCKRVLCITALRNSAVTEARIRGYRKACRDFGLAMDDNLLFTPYEASMECGEQMIRSALEQGVEFDGVFSQTDWLAIGALNALLAAGIRVPEEVKLVGFDDIRASRITRIPITTIQQPTAALSSRAGKLLLDMLKGKETNGKVELLPVSLVKRNTT